jgi:hypothetical protein
MRTTERITRLNDDWWLYEVKTDDPVILTRSFTVRYPMRNEPDYEWWEYACHEGNTIITNYVTTNRWERAHPAAEKPVKVEVPASFANALAGRWVGRPRIVTLDLDVELEFTKNADGTVQGKLLGTDLKTFGGKAPTTINKALRDFTMKDRRLNFEFPNTQPWTFAGELSADGTTLTGTVNSAQGGMPITFRKR